MIFILDKQTEFPFISAAKHKYSPPLADDAKEVALFLAVRAWTKTNASSHSTNQLNYVNVI